MISKKSTNVANTNYTTTNNYEDDSANAGGAGSLAASDGSSIVINSLSDGVANKAIDTSAGLALGAINTFAGLHELVYRDQEDARDAATLTTQNNTSLAKSLSELAVNNVAESKKDPNNATLENVAKYVLIAASVIVIGFVVIKTTKK